VRIEVGGYGINPYFVGRLLNPEVDRTQINTMVPPGLEAGETTVRVIYENQYSNEATVKLSAGSNW
jgi:uncharacterized protein (TIGR03437 family)